MAQTIEEEHEKQRNEVTRAIRLLANRKRASKEEKDEFSTLLKRFNRAQLLTVFLRMNGEGAVFFGDLVIVKCVD